MTSLKERQAQKLAEFIHLGQLRRDGKPYITHPERMVHYLKVSPEINLTEDMICATWLHDTLEMSEIKNSLPIISHTFGMDITHLILILTHEEHIPYNKYILNVAKYPDALTIKFVDMIDNTTDIVIGTQQFEKYRNACLLLQKNNIEVPKILKERLQIP